MGEQKEQGSAQRRLTPYLAIAGLALLLILPAAFRPPLQHDSFWINWVWADQFTELLRQGELYPRWLPRSHDGLGSPVFYYYPPLAFYLTGLLGLVGLSTWASILVAFGIGFGLSGVAMYHWLKDWTAAPLLGALFYMAAPYHVLDFVSRGNLAECLAFTFIPLVGLGLRKADAGKGLWLAALGYAGLILTHLPLALLVSLFFVGPFCLRLSRGRWRRLLPLGSALAIGLGLAAIYLVPALALAPFRDAAQLWSLPDFHAERWSLLNWNAVGPDPGMRALIAFTLGALASTGLLLFLRRRSGWLVWAALLLALAAGLVPGFWTLPLVEQVQFPFRLLPLAEFAIATAAATLPLSWPLTTLRLAPALLLSLTVLWTTPPEPPSRIEVALARFPDVPENLPPGEREYGWPSRWALALAQHHRTAHRAGPVTIEPVFFFPAWEVTCGGKAVPTFADPATKLLAHRGSGCTRMLGATRAERIGTAISLAALLALLASIVFGRTRRRSARRSSAR